MDWANLVAQGDSKRHEGAAAIRAQGTDAMTRGIQQGIAGITAGVLRKKEMAREDARTAKADARWERQFAQSTDELQFRKDTAYLHAAQAEEARDAQEEQMARGVPGRTPGTWLVPPNPEKLAALEKRKSERNANVSTVSQRAIGIKNKKDG